MRRQTYELLCLSDTANIPLSSASRPLSSWAALEENVIQGPSSLVCNAAGCILGHPAHNVILASCANPDTAHAAACAVALGTDLGAGSRGDVPEGLPALCGLVV
jgi:hypothetical protein